MARAHRSKAKHYRCARCQSLIAWPYVQCTNCGHRHDEQADRERAVRQAYEDELVRRIKTEFPGTTEVEPW